MDKFTAAGRHYAACAESDVPDSVRFDVGGRDGGQIVTRAWGAFPRTAAENGPGDAYCRISDGSDRSVRYYRRVK